jgi:hypothetical protein
MRLVIIFLLLFISYFSAAQFSSNQGHVWAKYSYGIIGTACYNNVGFSGEYLIHPNIGLNYNLELLNRSDNTYQIHSSVGALVGPPLIIIGLLSSNANSSSINLGKFGVFLGLAILAAPDGVAFHIPIRYHWDLSPYANVLGIDYVRQKDLTKGIFKWATSFGIKTTFWQEKGLTLNVFAETRKVASLNWAFGAGFGIGYAFSPRHSEKEVTVE